MKQNVWLVDDDEVSNFLSQKTLERMGVAKQIHIALNGKEALDLFNKYHTGSLPLPDLILLDLKMPVMDGFQFIELFNKLDIPDKEKVKIIIVTTSVDPNDVMRAKELGIEHFLSKPITEKDIKTFFLS